jgi:alkanesulfonate monooxygenase SsuD/methylene tetrahydromethanopterin reductase-like flavin-dependent oxidoreductase (luciferase family)
MDVGVGLPNCVPGLAGGQLVDWARRGEESGFSTLGTIDRLLYPNYESLIALAVAAAVTERVRLMTDILIPHSATTRRCWSSRR